MKHRYKLEIAILLISTITTIAKNAFSRGKVTNRNAFFGISRGGGLFWSKKEQGLDENVDVVVNASDKVLYPAMSQEEIEIWLSHIPVYVLTDPNGQGVVLRPFNDTSSVFYFFMSQQMANATLQTLKVSMTDMDLRVSAHSLGKVWFKIFEADKEIPLKLNSPNGTEEVLQNVDYRIVPDSRDLMGARMILTMDPKDGEKLKSGGNISSEDAQAAMRKAMTESPKFKSTFNEIPVFMIAQMRLQMRKAEDASTSNETHVILPMYFSLQNMVTTWKQFTAQSIEAKGMEPAIQLMDLQELITMMQNDSEIDFRKTYLIPPPLPTATSEHQAAPTQTNFINDDAMSKFGGETLGDI